MRDAFAQLDAMAEEKCDDLVPKYGKFAIVGFKEFDNENQRKYPCMLIYELPKSDGIDRNKIYTVRHIDIQNTIQALLSDLEHAQPCYASIPNSINSGQGYLDESEINFISEWPSTEQERNDLIVETIEYLMYCQCKISNVCVS